MALLLLVVGVLFNVFLAGLVTLKSRDRAARALLAVALGLIVWEVANFMSDVNYSPLLWNRLTFVGPLLVLLSSYVFVSELRGKKIRGRTVSVMFGGSIALGLICLLTPAVVPDVVPRIVNGIVVGYNPTRGLGYLVYIGWVGLFVVLHMLRVFARRTTETAIQRAQLELVRIGTVGAFVIPVITNVILPNLVDSSASAQFAPLMSIVYMGALSVAILKHKMLDIRDFIIRAAAFSLTTTVVGVLYVTPGVIFIMWVLGLDFSWYYISFSAIVGTIIAVNFARVQAWFARITNKIFFRESYEPTELMAELNRALLRTININKLLTATADIVERYLKAEFCYFILTIDKLQMPQKVYGTMAGDTQRRIVAEVLPALQAAAVQTVVVESLALGEERRTLTAHDVAVVLRLYVTGDEGKDQLGYMVIGPRKSGKLYGSADMKVLETVSTTLAIAVQDAVHYEEIKAFNTTLQERINDATEELTVSNRKLQKLDESKDEFISMASHQLRTPLTTVKGYLSMVLDGDAGKITPKQRQVLEEAFSSSQRMVYLISDFLNVSRLQTGKFELELKETNLADILTQEVKQLQDSATSRQMKLEYERPAHFPTLMCDENKVRQVIMNFIDNAVYYTRPKDTIRITLSVQGNEAVFKVIDHGIGVPASERHKLFEKFYRATNAKKQRPDGTGIGLFMSRKVVVAHGGSIIFESVEGKGSTFGFRLPLKKALENSSK